MRITLAVLAGIAALVLPGTAAAIPPANDNFANATAIDVSSLPYSETVSLVEAGYEPGESAYCGVSNTVWYSFTPSSDALVRVDSSGSSFFGAVFNAYRQNGAGIGGLSQITCSSYGGPLLLSVESGTTYYIQAGSAYWGSGDLRLTVEEIPPPGNDDFADATAIGSVPFSDSVDATAASIESGEPTPSCGYGQSAGTIWYAFTPSVSRSYSVTSTYTGLWPQVAVYTGSSLANLTDLGCRTFGSMLTFRAEAGQTYYLQLGGLFGARGRIIFSIDVAPDPVANFGLYPGDPSSFDNVGFSDFSYDPAGLGIQTRSWSFGDGSTGTGCCPAHRYAADGTYEVTLTVTTPDGRSASLSRQIEVRTHDVAIAKMQVPQSANVGQTRQVVVGLSNKRYGETVQVQLFKSGPGGYELVGTLTQSVPIRSGGRTTDFKFSYTFTSADAAVGKVTFKAVASLVNARDAAPADNEAISLPTKVNG
ncbi:MAG TPA: PKD domain-containing protein [Gaiellaceae bacterium]|nr:PKD domain-containing protein [Gaiellaceae bacterium]